MSFVQVSRATRLLTTISVVKGQIDSDVFLAVFEMTEMCKNVDDYIKRDFGDKGLCRDLRNPVGNDSIDP